MFKLLLPYLALYRRFFFSILFGLFLIILALSASIFLLSLSGWFLAMCAFVGVAGLYTFNYMLPATGVRGFAISRTVARYFERVVNHDITFKILSFLRIKAFKKLLPLSPAQLSHYDKGDLLNRFIADIDHLDHLYLRLFTPILSALIVTFFIYLGLSFFDVRTALFFTFILLIAILVLPFTFYFLGKEIGQKITQKQAQYRSALTTYLAGQAELILFNAEQNARIKLDKIEQEWLSLQKKQNNLIALASCFVVLICALLILVSFLFLTEILPQADKPFIALFVFTGLAAMELLTPIAHAFIFLGQVVESAKRMNQLYEQKPDIIFPEKTILPNSSEVFKKTVSKVTLQLNHLHFAYSNSSNLVLDDLNLTLKAGEKIALIGASGEGKSTLFKLLLREYNAPKRSILLNQIPIEQFDESNLRSLISVVPQTIDLLSDTLRNNLLLANPNADDNQLIASLKQVHLDKLLNTKEALDLMIGEQGRALSGGEMRRIGIARCLLKNAPLILLDEPTESLDQFNEQEIMTLFRTLYRDKTLIMITHKSHSLADFDRVVELKNGKFYF